MRNKARVYAILIWLELVVLLAAAPTALATEILWSQSPNGNASFGPSVLWSGEYDQEFADDFDVTGLIERIYAQGYGCFQCVPPTVTGVYVRFYAHTESGPGDIQAEYFLAGDDPSFIYDPEEPADLDITLPTPFAASGLHFFSIQMVMNGYWDWWESNHNAPNLSRIYTRDNLAGGVWQYYDFVGYGNADVGFDLYGEMQGAPRIDSLSHTTIDRSGRLRLFGANFGQTQGESQVLIDGLPAIIGRWNGYSINAYVPEAAGPGPVTVQVVTPSGTSNALSLDVNLRQPDGRLRWRFQADGLYALVRPAIGPDGSIYVVDVYGSLYALSPDGGLRYIVHGAGGKGVDVGPDGVIYTGDENQIMAVNPDGSVRWVFEQSPRAFILLGPNVGPDGNIYAVATEGIGVFSLTPDGDLRWTYPEAYRRPITDYQEIKFGYNGDTLQLYYHANDHFRAFSAGGDLAWSYGPFMGRGNPEVGPDQTIYNQAILRYDPDGNVIGSFVPPSPNNGATAPHVARSTGNIYHVTNGATLRSLMPDLEVRWARNTGLILGNPYPDPADQLVVMSGAEGFGMSGFAVAMSTADGQELWRVPFPPENGGNHLAGSNPRFTADGSVVYMNTDIAGPAPGDSYWYVYAMDTGLVPNQPPSAGDDSYETAADTPLSVAAPGVLANDLDPEGASLTAVWNGGPSHGALSLSPDGSFVYTPADGYSGTDNFTYRAGDGLSQSNVATVTIEILAPPPPAENYLVFLPAVVR